MLVSKRDKLRSTKPTSESGFSLLELLAAAACATILLAAAIPNIYHFQQEWTLWGSAHALEVSLQWGRTYAISANSSIMLEVDDGGRQFYWADPVSGDRYENTVRHLPDPIRIVRFPKRPLRFYQHGNAAPAGTYVLQGKTRSYRVVVSPGGRIRLQKN